MHEEVQSKALLATQGRRRFEAKQKWPRNRPKQPKNGPKQAIFGCASKRRDADSERSERQHHPCYTKAPSSPVPPGGFQGAEMADVLHHSRRSPRKARTGQKLAKTAQKRAKTGHFWLHERAASGGQRAKREAAPSLLYESPIQPCATRGVPGC